MASLEAGYIVTRLTQNVTTGMGDDKDAYGRLLLAYHAGRPRAHEIVERDDGFIEASAGPGTYFAPFRRWSPAERQGLRLASIRQ